MEKNLEIIELFDIYSSLLTDRQKEIFSSYYLYDLSLAEIAEPNGTTRQSVHEIIKSTTEKLTFFEAELKLRQKKQELTKAVLENCDRAVAEKLLEIIGR